MKRLGVVALGLALLLACTYAILAMRIKPVADRPFFAHTGVDVIAHRGGRGLWPENTLFAFRRAALGADVLDMDIQCTRDGALVVIHDATVDRTTNGTGAVKDFSLADLQALDAGYRWTADGGKTFPYRGQGIAVPTLASVFAAFPAMRMSIEIKQTNPDITGAFCALIRRYGMADRVLVACFDSETLQRFRSQCPEVATSAGLREGLTLYLLSRMHLAAAYCPPVAGLQVPLHLGALNGTHPAFLSAARGHNLRVEVWTVDDTATMRALVARGVDGIVTDYPDRLLGVLGR